MQCGRETCTKQRKDRRMQQDSGGGSIFGLIVPLAIIVLMIAALWRPSPKPDNRAGLRLSPSTMPTCFARSGQAGLVGHSLLIPIVNIVMSLLISLRWRRISAGVPALASGSGSCPSSFIPSWPLGTPATVEHRRQPRPESAAPIAPKRRAASRQPAFRVPGRRTALRPGQAGRPRYFGVAQYR
jgi:hypothetical protein